MRKINLDLTRVLYTVMKKGRMFLYIHKHKYLNIQFG